MELELNAEQEALRAAVRGLLDKALPERRVRELAGTVEGFDRDLWRRMATELGLHGLAVPEQFGGAGFGYAELGVVFEELGRALYGGPFLSSVVLAGSMVQASGDEKAQADLLPQIVSGDIIATVAVTEAPGSWTQDQVQAVARAVEDGYLLDGCKVHVPDGAVADTVLVAARTDAGVSIFVVRADAPGVTSTSVPTMDQTRKQATLVFRDAPARLLGTEGAGWALVETALDIGCAAMAAEQLGAAERLLEMTVEYAKIREQYGRPIGSFQAIKHMCSRMLLDVDSMRSLVLHAVRVADENPERLAEAASMAKAFCAERFCAVARDAVQIHGGIGVTWEHPVQLYFKRAYATRVLFGGPGEHRERVLRLRGV